MTHRIATVSFLNAWPLVETLRDHPDVTLTADMPSRLSELLWEDRADVALIPVVEWFRGAGAEIVPGVAIATGGAVDSVKLFAKVPPPEIRHVAVDRGSRTSVALLRILFAELWGVEPDFRVVAPQVDSLLDETDAALVIGDRCFQAEARFQADGARDVHTVDLGEAWQQMTGLPFVFAVWVTGVGFTRSADPAARAALMDLLREAKDAGLERVDALAARAAAQGALGPGGVSDAAAIRGYFTRSLSYDLGDAELAGLRRFHRLCVDHQIVPDGRGVVTAAPVHTGESHA
ncbi:MAG TPA: menaquinone biosynthesis protein [Candidatus Krumholzibacteria bacterium]|nr:menaquinone biosynthesis protein [Candidatus Krumholzibacteria bacterium]